MDGSFPWRWKIRCPVGGEEYPSNDFARGDMTSGPFADDGIGGACLHDGKKYGFIAELCQFYCRRMMAVAPDSARAYAGTGDRRYAHKALVALCRLAAEYVYLATMTQHRHRNSVSQVERVGQGRFEEGPCLASSGFTTYCIEQPGQLAAHAEAYDRILDARSRQAVFLDANTHPEAKAAKLAGEFPEFPAGSWFELYDYGVGDEVIWPYSVSVTLESPGRYRLVAPVPVRADLPEGNRATSAVVPHGRSRPERHAVVTQPTPTRIPLVGSTRLP